MNRQEFINEVIEYASAYDKEEAIVKVNQLTSKEYECIEFVYNYHPCVDNVTGKKQVAMLFVEFGLRVFSDMKPTADNAKKIETELFKMRRELEQLECEYGNLKNINL